MHVRSLQMYRPDDPFDSIMGGLAADGGVIVEDFIDQDLVTRLNAQLDADIEKTEPGSEHVREERRKFWGSRTKRLSRLAARAPAFVELLDHDLMHRWARHTLAADYWLNTGQAMIVGPGETAQVLHRDIAIWPLVQETGKAAPEVMVSVILALSDFTEEVGATRVVPGSHLWDDFKRTPNREESVGAVMPAGSALLYLGKTVHGAGGNVTQDLWRHGLHMSFVVGWLTPEEASPLGVPWEIARTHSGRVQRMLGYASPGPGSDEPPRNWLIDFVDVRNHLGVRADT
ncbi:MAG: phytanoyl-CoA dioxygenase [Gammaproteobacteria bacterium]|nr:phytanoyl-CoA dioxygenase [Gammaproteobacteria bacterium]